MSVLSDELHRIWDEQSALTPALVVDAARPETSPLHARFEWDNDEAAEQWRLAQAAGLIREAKLRVTINPPGDETSYYVREWVPASYVGAEAPAGGYVQVTGLTGPQRDLLLRRMRREIEGLRRRYGSYEQFWTVLDDIRAQRGERVTP